jgi:hypothetical protein
VTHEHDRIHNKPTGGPTPAEVEAGLADPAQGGLNMLAPEVVRLPGREPIDARGLSMEDIILMIRDQRDATDRPDPADPGTPSEEAGLTREHIEEERSEVPSEPLSPDDVVFTDETTPGNWIIIGCGDEKGEHGFIVEGTTRPSRSGDVADTEGEMGNEPREKTSEQPSEP